MRLVILFSLVLLTAGARAQVRRAAQVAQQPPQITSSHFSGGTFTPQWSGVVLIPDPADPSRSLSVPDFRGSSADEIIPNLPCYKMLVPVSANEQITVGQAGFSGETREYSDMFDRMLSRIPENYSASWYPASPVVAGPRVTIRKQEYQVVRIYPVRISVAGGLYEKARAVEYSLSRTWRPAVRPAYSRKTETAHSVLATGQWYKIGVTQDGLYSLNASALSSMGIDVNAIDPREIRIYGTGGGMLPQDNSVFRYDDLPENAIYVTGESDGRFDAGDQVVFFGAGPHKWVFDSIVFGADTFPRYYHLFNTYSDTTFYFLTIGGGQGRRITSIPSASGVNYTPVATTDYAFYEKDEYNYILSGRAWLGEIFDFTTSRTFNFPVPALDPGSVIDLHVRAAARSNFANSFMLRESGNPIASISPPATNTAVYGSYYYRTQSSLTTLSASSITDGSVDIELEYNKPDLSSIGWLDYIELNYRKQLTLPGSGAWFFTVSENTGPGSVYGFNLNATNLAAGWGILDVTDPVNVTNREYSVSGNTISFGVSADTRRRLLAWTPQAVMSPASSYAIGNQDLHGLPQADYFIITTPELWGPATQLAQMHISEGMSVSVVNVHEIYNEFSSGAPDPSAIRDFLKLFYDRAGSNTSLMPQYALMFGDGSYDYKNRAPGPGKNHVITYQSRKSMGPIESYTSDDFFGFLDADEGMWGEKASVEGGTPDVLNSVLGDFETQTHYLDIGIGRFPVNTVDEANVVVNKIVQYRTAAGTFGNWRNRILLIADHKDADGNIHVSQADSYSPLIEAANPCMNIDKVYLDNYNMVNTPNGTRFPDGKDEMQRKIQEGSLIVNYTGHGGETGWSNSKILENPDIAAMTNAPHLPVYVTATCEFGRWDDPARASGGENVFLHEGGGSIAMFTTVRVVYSHPNYELNKKFYDHVFEWDSVNQRHLSLGEIFMKTKNDAWQFGVVNNRNFTLMGDPALILNYPRHEAVITEINGRAVQPGVQDTLRALSLVTVNGRVEDRAGNPLTSYSGDLSITVYDKPSKFVTKRAPFTFLWQKNRLFNGVSSINNGAFSFQFVVPVDISYEPGNGKISLYFSDYQTDGGGCDNEIHVGGTGNIVDEQPPQVDVIMNGDPWADGGITGVSPKLIAKVSDDHGINTAGNGIGHELTCILNGDENNVLVLNNFFTADKNSYKTGRINYPFENLPQGEHEVRVKVWDVANNSAEGSTRFVVADNARIALGHVLNYPNPFSTHTTFIIEHNSNGANLDAVVKIFSVSGKMIKSMEETFYAEGNLYDDISWDGLDEYGDPIGRGVYVYQVTLKNRDTGEKATTFEKLVLLR